MFFGSYIEISETTGYMSGKHNVIIVKSILNGKRDISYTTIGSKEFHELKRLLVKQTQGLENEE